MVQSRKLTPARAAAKFRTSKGGFGEQVAILSVLMALDRLDTPWKSACVLGHANLALLVDAASCGRGIYQCLVFRRAWFAAVCILLSY